MSSDSSDLEGTPEIEVSDNQPYLYEPRKRVRVQEVSETDSDSDSAGDNNDYDEDKYEQSQDPDVNQQNSGPVHTWWVKYTRSARVTISKTAIALSFFGSRLDIIIQNWK